MPHTKTYVEEKVDELAITLSTAANEWVEARKNYGKAKERRESAEVELRNAKRKLDAYLSSLENVNMEKPLPKRGGG